ncbi:MAG: M48 family metallopeptidase [Bacteroidales bacterium]|nr:M48 family metallopeptidase [Candidatus Latescibacterota bacterium]
MDLKYTIKRSAKRDKLTITVERNREVVIHAPATASEETIARVVKSRRQWIFEKLSHTQKYQPLPHPPGKEFVSGESALYLGRAYRIEVVKKGLLEVQFKQRFLVPSEGGQRPHGALRAWYEARAKEVILPRVAAHAATLGVDYNQAKIVDARYRWGSCTVINNVNFNWRLIKAPSWVIDYVIIHELAHLIEANHTPRFWNIVRSQVTRMEKAKAWLSENGQLLEQEI